MSGAVLFVDDFSGDSGGLAKTSLVNWNVLNGTNVDIGDFGALCSAGASSCVDTQGSGGNSSGDIETKSSFALSSGFNYTFSYTANNTGASTVRIRIGSAVDALVPAVDGTYSIPFVTTAQSATIRITDQGPADNVGVYLGHISLSADPVTGAVPEPSTFVLFAAGIVGLATVSRKTRRVN